MATMGHVRQFSGVDLPDRKRRRLHISEAESYNGPKDMLSNLQHTYEADRVGVPPVKLLPLGTEVLDDDNPIWRKFHQTRDLQQDIEQVIKKFKINVHEKDLVLRYDGFEPAPENSVTTFYIQTQQDSTAGPADQRAFVVELYHLLRDGYNFKNEFAVTIELIGHRLWAPREICHLEFDHPFFQAWQDRLEGEFMKTLQNQPPDLVGKWRSVDVVRLGFDLGNRAKNPVTVSITVDWSVDPPTWKNAHKIMLDLIKSESFNYQVEVEFERGEIFMVGDEDQTEGPRPRRITPAQAVVPGIRPGCSISGGTAQMPAEPVRSSGTGGVVMEVVEKNTSSQEILATVLLTNYHVARFNLKGFQLPDEDQKKGEKWPDPENNSICANMDGYCYYEPRENNSGNSGKVSQFVYRSPSKREIDDSIEMATKDLAEVKQSLIEIPQDLTNNIALRQHIQSQIDSTQKYLEVLQNIRVDNLGSIFYSGGLNRKHPTGSGRLDVAAIKLDDDVAKNASNGISHRENEWPSNYPKPATNSITQFDEEFGKIINKATAKKVGRVYKIGAKTGCTTGFVTGKKCHNVNLPWHEQGDYSCEVSMIGESEKWFSWMGNSGAAVFDVYGRLLGLLFAGQTKFNTERLMTYVIPIHAIKEDFEQATGQKYTLRIKQ